MFKIDMTSPDLDKQIELLKHYPEVMEKHYKSRLVKVTSILFSSIRGSIPRLTGRAMSKFRKSVTGKGVNLTGRVGWWGGGNQPWHINVVEHGAKPHEIKAKPGGYLRLMGGRFVKSVQHPGLSARGFMAAGFSALKPLMDAEMQQAGDAVLKEMEVK